MSRHHNHRPPNYPLRRALLAVVVVLAAIGGIVRSCSPTASAAPAPASCDYSTQVVKALDLVDPHRLLHLSWRHTADMHAWGLTGASPNGVTSELSADIPCRYVEQVLIHEGTHVLQNRAYPATSGLKPGYTEAQTEQVADTTAIVLGQDAGYHVYLCQRSGLPGNCSAPIVTRADVDEVEHLLAYR
jgi:hypothetical protein